MSDEKFDRAALLLGSGGMQRLAEARVIVFGVGGVGSWCVESLVRTGVGHITIVDFDLVAESNINRQMMATSKTVGLPKVEALRSRLLEINPQADIAALNEPYTPETCSKFDLESFDVIIDCIDSLRDKALLIERATSTKRKFYSSMGAALKIDPTRVKVAEFWKVNGCPLARALRQRFKKQRGGPKRKFTCVFSDELIVRNPESPDNSSVCKEKVDTLQNPTATKKANGSLMHITAILGLTLAGLAISYLRER